MTWDVTSWFKEQASSRAPDVVRKFQAAYLQDRTSNEHDAVGLGSPSFIAGTVAPQRVVLDGIDDYFALLGPSYESSSLTHGLTVEVRFDTTSALCAGSSRVLADYGFDRYWMFLLSNSTHYPFFYLHTDQGDKFTAAAFDCANGSSHMMSARYDPSTNGGQLALMIDGSSYVVTDSIGTVWGSGDRRYGVVGARGAASTFNGETALVERFSGSIEELRIWHIARTDSEISSHYDSTSISNADSGLQLHYDMKMLGDLTGRVTRWPTIRRSWNDLRGQTADVELANDDGALNMLFTRPQAGLTTFNLQIGFTHPTSGDETITPFLGRMANVGHKAGALKVGVEDKISQLSDYVVGDTENPVTMSSVLPSDIAWTLCTCYGPFSDVASTSNTDIDYASFLEWAAVFSGDNVIMDCRFDGQKTLEGMRKISRQTQSAIYMEGGLMRFYRFTAVNTESTDLSEGETTQASIEVDMLALVTKQTVLGGYNADSDSWAFATFDIDSESSVSYGLREDVEKDKNVWYVNSVSALNLAQRFTSVGGNPYEQVTVDTTLVPIVRQVGETISFQHSQTQIARGYRIMELALDFGRATMTLGINASQTETPFILDVSTLDGSDKLL